MINYFYVFCLLLVFSCDNSKGLTPKEIRIGTFRTELDNTETNSIASRDAKFQIETFNGKKDTFLINWKSDFEYILKKWHPKTVLDSTEFVVKITGIHKKHYTFKAYYKGSNYKQKGKAYKIND